MARKVRLSCRNDIFRWRSFSLRGPSTIWTAEVWNTGFGIARPERRERGQLFRDLARDVAERQRAVEPQPRAEVVGPQPLFAPDVDGLPEFLDARALDLQPRRLAVAAEAQHHRRARLERRQHVEARDAAARPVRDAVLDRQHDRRAVERVDDLRRDDADHAAVPSLAGDDEHRSRSDFGIGLDHLARLGDDVLLFLASARVLDLELFGEAARLVGHPLVGGQQQPRRDVGRAHAAGGVDPRREHEGDVVAVDLLAGQAGGVEQRAQADLVRSLRQHLQAELGDHAVLADERDDVGERADGGDLDERRAASWSCPPRWHSAWTSLSATPTPARCLSA